MGLFDVFKKNSDKKVYKNSITKRDNILDSPKTHVMKIRPAGETYHQASIKRLHQSKVSAASASITFEEYEFEGHTAIKKIYRLSFRC